MRGHQALIDLRRQGVRPRSVWFAVDAPEPMAAGWQHWSPSAHVGIEPTDSIGTLDLRLVVGMVCHVLGTNERRCKALHEACRQAGAAKVVTTVVRPAAREKFETVCMWLDGELVHDMEAA